MELDSKGLGRTPLYGRHVEAGARMVPFAGYLMPVQYSGIIGEHLQTREKVGLFDTCHMGEFLIRGPAAEADVDRLVTCRVDDMSVGQCRYGFLTNTSGGIIDDLIVFKMSTEEYMLVVNAGTREKDAGWISRHLSTGTSFCDVSDGTAKIDLQGPDSMKILSEIPGFDAGDTIKRFHFTFVEIEGVRVLLSRTGYTGEVGYELFCPSREAVRLWDLLLGFEEVKPIGLGARDTLRLEAGYPLYGHDICEDRSPIEAGLERFVYFDKNFMGCESLRRQRDDGCRQEMTAFVCEGRRSAREQFSVSAGGRAVGTVTSAGFSPCLKRGIGLCYVDKEFASKGQEISLSGAGLKIPAVVEQTPVYKKRAG